ncbi:MAG: hypothetical protein DWQ31_01220 [Planctomycetota bacterium]|nr:MAG: hypothetical protein DWQ31_01220 [Planctomycetota bacterium]REJ90913.1 MAG: hypothetical protein DWQ35_15630 [Planctomycetota bacterium]REK17690.1 MAG: hypothetical protein DWQ42_21845 [Planctomycetota bacterium]REK46743.1 MAG: hypothetical protein DWQ46_05955 [Planctomycetota bacterium]
MTPRLPRSPGEKLAELTKFRASDTILANIVAIDALDVRFDDDVETMASVFLTIYEAPLGGRDIFRVRLLDLCLAGYDESIYLTG